MDPPMRTRHRIQITEMVVKPTDQQPSTRYPETVVKLTEEGDAVYLFQPWDNTGGSSITITRDNWELLADAVDSLFEGIPVPEVDDPSEPLKPSYEQ